VQRHPPAARALDDGHLRTGGCLPVPALEFADRKFHADFGGREVRCDRGLEAVRVGDRYGTSTLLAADSASASALRMPTGVRSAPEATGFRPMTRRPCRASSRTRPAETTVLPTPVSVPVTKMPCVISIRELIQKLH